MDAYNSHNEAEFSYLKYSNFYPLIAEKYKLAIQYRLIKVAWQHWQEVNELLNVISNLCERVVCVN